ncbi:MAG: rod shape-determining protein MreC [Rickettsiales bacterium]|jgi:cell shape-determining protein MreC|nr:rod shape-determining protein MreC [Rickettsiales bacterium]
MQRKKRFLSAFLSAILVPVAVIVIMIDKPDYRFFNFIHTAVVPIAEFAGQGLSYPIRLIGKITDGIRKNKETLRENAKIMAELADLHKVLTENEILRRENGLMREKLKIAESMGHEFAVAKIIHDNSFAENQSFVAKSPDGRVLAGNVVVSNSGYILGVISENAGGFARIRSIRDGDSNIPVRIAGTDIFGFMQGSGSAGPELRFLSDGDFVPKEGMFLITSGVNGNIPSDIPVGRIESAKPDEITVRPGGELKGQESAIILFFGKSGGYE